MRQRPGVVRDAIIAALSEKAEGASLAEISRSVAEKVGVVAESSVRSYLRLNTPSLFVRTDRAQYRLKTFDLPSKADPSPAQTPSWDTFRFGQSVLVRADCMHWLARCSPNSIHAVVTDPPYGLVEYSDSEQAKLRAGRGGVWRIPPSFDGARRTPLPRFTVLKQSELDAIESFFFAWGKALLRVLVPGANVLVASNPLLSYIVAGSLASAGLERRGELVRLVMTMRGGDRPKDAHLEYADVSVMPRSQWEPWLMFRKPLDGRVQDNLRKWGTGGFRRPSSERPFGDVIESAPTRGAEREIAPHPSLKPQAFLRQVVRASLPLGKGIVLDPFAGSGSMIAAAESIGYAAIGIERDKTYYDLATRAIPKLRQLDSPSLRGQR